MQSTFLKKQDEQAWFAMRATYRREMDAKRLLDSKLLESFIPMHYKMRTIKGRNVRELVPAIHNLIFVHATSSQLKQVKETTPYLQYLTDSRSGQKIIVPDQQMHRFIALAGTYNDQLIYLQPEEINYAKGTPVRITGGDFEGYEGIFVKVKGARDKRVVVSIRGIIAVAMATVRPEFIETIL